MLVPFQRVAKTSLAGRSIRCYAGTPDCAAFYAWVLAQLKQVLSKWQPVPAGPTTGQKGNLGEHIAYLVARHSGMQRANGYTAALAGALTPLSDGTFPGLDITFIYLDANGDASKDALFIQEVKTTGNADLSYAMALVDDHQKLLDTTRPSTSLGARMGWLKAKLEYELEFAPALIERTEDLFRPQPQDCTRIRLLPTLVHEHVNADPVVALDKVMEKISAMGWLNIEPWSIALTQLNECLLHLAKQSPFKP